LPRRSLLTCLVCAACLAGAPLGAHAADGAEAYAQHCAACHLAEGEGVPAAFPPLNERLGRWAAVDAGRDYLVSVVSNGLFGQIEVDGVTYAGAMPPMRHLDAETVAQILSFVVSRFGQAEDAAFTAAEVTATQQRLGPQQSHAIRPGD
jgi:mono/diheme cytochrome c family protein